MNLGIAASVGLTRPVTMTREPTSCRGCDPSAVSVLRENVVCGADRRTRICFSDAVTAPTAVTVKGEAMSCNEDDAAGGNDVGGDSVTTGAGTRVEDQRREDPRDDTAVDPTKRMLTLRDDKGTEDTFSVGQTFSGSTS